MCYPAVKWLPQAKTLLKSRLFDSVSFTSLDFKGDLRAALPSHDIKQAAVGQFLREAYKEGLMPGFESVAEDNHLRYQPINLSLWQKVKTIFKR